ncbi:MAG: dNTP triphosphohydrolase [bacterium]|nr:dNTP triphosphohydrolase [bacterium]
MDLPNWLSNKRYKDIEKNDSNNLLKKKYGSDERNDFAIDIDSIVHCASFRRLAYKTQVLLNPMFDFPRTRLVHSIETMRIARQLAAMAFRIIDYKNKIFIYELIDALSAVCLAHDIGHSPFGHAGEKALDKLLKDSGNEEGFNANKQNIRVLCGYRIGEDKLFRHRLNLTVAVLDGLMKDKKNSTFSLDKKLFDFVQSVTKCNGFRNPLTYFMDAADDIANMACDCEDGMKFELLRKEILIKTLKDTSFKGYDTNWEKIEDWEELIRKSKEEDDYDRLKSSLIKGLVVHFCNIFKSIVDNAIDITKDLEKWPTILDYFLKNQANYPTNNKGEPDEVFNILFYFGPKDEFKNESNSVYELKKSIYPKGLLTRTRITETENDAQIIIFGLWSDLKIVAERPTSIQAKQIINLLPNYLKILIEQSPIFQEVCSNKNDIEFNKKIRYRLIADHIAAMTDRYAIKMFKRLRGIKTVL